MGNLLAELDGVELEGGRDLDHAYRCCDLHGTAALSRRPAPIRHAANLFQGVVRDARNAEFSRLGPQTSIVTGTERASGAPMRVLFRCRPKTVEFAARHILGSNDFERTAASLDSQAGHDVLVTDHPLLDVPAWKRSSAVRVAHWLRQRVELGSSWSETLAHLPASLRKELRRWLGKRDYRARIVAGMPAKAEFYNRALLPYVRRRFGAAAIVPNERTFMKEAEAAVLLELHAADACLGASLFRYVGDTLFIGRTAFWPAQGAPSEVLDYFCFVVAQRLGCRWLDFGLTRPHVEDGVLLYKAKWRPQLIPVGGIKSDIRIRPLRPSAATLGFLSRNGFIERRDGQYFIRRLSMAGHSDANCISELAALAERVNLDRMVVGCAGDPSFAATAGRVTSRALGDVDDPIRAFRRLQ